MLYSVQTMLFKAGGQVGEEPEAVSRVWLPGAPCGTCCCKGRPRMRIRGAILPSGIVRMLAARGWLLPGVPKNKKWDAVVVAVAVSWHLEITWRLET